MFNFFKSKKKELTITPGGIKPMVLIILDGYGIAPSSEGNAITRAKTPHLDRFFTQYPHGELIASGESVGLPANEEGNSEVGHLTLGAGGVIPQSLKRINQDIEEMTFYDNKAFIQAIAHVRKFKSKLHIMGLVSTGSVHSSLEHFYALIELCRKSEVSNVYYHLFTDGRDAPPQMGARVISEIEGKIQEMRVGQIATISGRYYAMDRDMRWQRTQRTYEAIVEGKGVFANSAGEIMRNAYAKGQTDEFIEPAVIIKGTGNREQGTGVDQAKPVATVDDNDAVIFFNFRVDRPRQLTMAFVRPDFENLESIEVKTKANHASKERTIISGPTFQRRRVAKNLFFVTMTEYQKQVKVSAVAYASLKAQTSLPLVLSKHKLKQLHLTESEKERMVTIYFDGLHEGRLPDEHVLIVPSPKVATYDKKPQMSIYEIVEEFNKALAKNTYHFYVLNFANPDMVAHSGNIKATIKAVEHVDKALGEVVEAVLAIDGTVVITADHGNAEELLAFPTTSYFFTTSQGEVNTDHSTNPVPILIINNRFAKKPFKLPRGTLSDVAPTILSMMKLPIPSEMTGHSLLEKKEEHTVPLSSILPMARGRR